MAEWGTGIPYAGWIVTDVRNPRGASIHGVVATHNPECDVDHGGTRYVFVDFTFVETHAYAALRELGYRLMDLETFAEYPGAEGVLEVLGIREVASGFPLCLGCEGEVSEVEQLLPLELEAFGRDPLEMPDVIGMAIGPIPRMTDELKTPGFVER
jgi:hypothetical protein